MPWNCCKKDIMKCLQELVDTEVIYGYSLGFVDEIKSDCYYGGVQGCIPPYNNREIKQGMLYDLASLTKVIATSTRIMQLLENHVLNENTKVKDILVNYLDDNTTIKDLMFHTSGLPQDLVNKERLNKENIRDELYKVKPMKKGEMKYSDIGFAMLGFIIEELDESLEESCQAHIFRPLGMKHTSWMKNEQENLYVPTEVTKDRGCICRETHDRKAFLLEQSGTAGLFSTLEDLIKFVSAMLQENSVLLNKKSFHKFKEDVVQGRTWGWAKPYGKSILYHTGFTGTSINIDMENKKGMILLTNRIHPTRNNVQFIEAREKINKIFMEEIK